MRWTLPGFIVAVALVLSAGLWQRLRPVGFEAALAEILDGDADREERLSCLSILRDRGLELARTGDRRAGLIAAMAAVDLDDAPGYEAAVRLVGGKTSYLPGVEGTLPNAVGSGRTPELAAASLSEPYLHNLMLAHDAENRGKHGEARRRFRQTLLSAGLFGSGELARTLAQNGLRRVR